MVSVKVPQILICKLRILVTCRGGSRGRLQGVHPPLPDMTYGFLIQLVFCIKICLHHQSVTPFLSGAPGAAPVLHQAISVLAYQPPIYNKGISAGFKLCENGSLFCCLILHANKIKDSKVIYPLPPLPQVCNVSILLNCFTSYYFIINVTNNRLCFFSLV